MFSTIKFIYTHPLNKNNKTRGVLKFFLWQIVSRLWKSQLVFNWLNDSKLIVENSMTGATGNIYVGLMEYEDMSFLLHYVNKDDLFFDIGANVGVYTVLASKVKSAKTVSVEPLPLTYDKLIDNIKINRIEGNVISENIGLSFEKSELHFTNSKDTMNRVALESDTDVQIVNVETLDNLSGKYGLPRILKIDVEGFEYNVLLGGENTLDNENLEVIIVELNGSGEKFGFSDDNIHAHLLEKGFRAHNYLPFERKLVKLDTYGNHNTIYIRESVLERIELNLLNAEKIIYNGISL